MNEFVIRLSDERGRVQEQTHTAASADELRTRFTQAGYYVYSIKARGALASAGKKKVKLETFLIFNQQFLTLIRAGLPILGAYKSVRGGHKLNHAVLTALMADRSAWKIVDADPVRRARPEVAAGMLGGMVAPAFGPDVS